MQVGLAQCVNKGMQRDYSMDKASQEFAYENRNIRITTNGDNSFLSVTNEKSTVELHSSNILCVISNSFTGDLESNLQITHNIPSDIEVELKITLENQEEGYEYYDTFIINNKSKSISEYYSEDTILKVESLNDNYSVIITRFDDEELNSNAAVFISGTIIGNATIGNSLVLFTKGASDYIYKCTINEEINNYSLNVLYEGDLNFDIEHPIECTTSYEGDEVQKVYWVDGKNQPRYINICKTYTNADTFDFVPSIVEGMDVSIEKEYNGTGKFTSGVIQYFITYYKKFGSETSAVYQSPLYYISPKDRGGKIDEVQTCNFKITITPKTDKYDYVKVYSLIRTSLDAEPQASIVGDVSITKDSNGKFNSIEIVDNNDFNTPIAPTDVMFIGGNTIIASTIEQKSNTLFLGNIITKASSLSELGIAEDVKTEVQVQFGIKIVKDTDNSSNSNYDYVPNMEGSSEDTTTFKYLEWYRVGIQFQLNTGEWTQTFFIKDIQNTVLPGINPEDSTLPIYNPYENVNNISIKPLTMLYATITEKLIKKLKDNNVINWRLAIAQHDGNSRTIKAQGLILPTLFNIKERTENQCFASPIWTLGQCQYGKHFVNVDTIETNKTAGEEIEYDSKSTTTFLPNNVYYNDNASSTNPLKDANLLHNIVINEYENKNLGYSCICGLRLYISVYRLYASSIEWMEWGDFLGTNYTGDIFYAKLDIVVKKEDGSTSTHRIYINNKDNSFNILHPEQSITWVKKPYGSRKKGCKEFISKLDNLFWSELADYSISGLKIYDGGRDFYVKELSNFNGAEQVLKDGEFPTADELRIDCGVSNNVVDKDYEGSLPRDFSYTIKEEVLKNYENNYFLDANICNFLSPDIENVSEGLNLRLIGYTNINNVISDYKVEVEDPELSGDIYKVGIWNFNSNKTNSTPSYLTGITSYPLWPYSTALYTLNYWQQGKEITEENFKLKTKKFANMWYLADYTLLDNNIDYGNIFTLSIPSDTDILDFGIYKPSYDNMIFPNSGVQSIKIKNGNAPDGNGGINETLDLEAINSILNNPESVKGFTKVNNLSGIHIKLNSSKHAVFQLPSNDLKEVLPNYENSIMGLSDLTGYTLTHHFPVDFIICGINSRRPNYEYLNSLLKQSYNSSLDNLILEIQLNADKTQANVNLKIDGESQYILESSISVPTNTNTTIIKDSNNNELNRFNFLESYIEDVGSIKNVVIYIAYYQFYFASATYRDYDSETNTTYYNLSNAVVSNASITTYYTRIEKNIYTLNFPSTNTHYIEATPHTLNSTQEVPDKTTKFWIGEFYTPYNENNFMGGTSENALEKNVFIPVSGKYSLIEDTVINDEDKKGACGYGLEGDTYFQRWDYLRTYPISTEDINQPIDAFSLNLETYKNLDADYRQLRGRQDVTVLTEDNTNNVLNTVYNQSNNYITSSILDDKFNDSSYPNLYVWSLQKTLLSDVDNWTSINLSNSLQLDADKGILTKIKNWNDKLLAFQDKGISIINFNNQTTISSKEGVPVEIANSGRVTGHYYLTTTQGCKNKWSIVDSPYGLYFIDSYNKSINVFSSDGIKSLSTINLFEDWTKENERGIIWNPNNTQGFKSFYDPIHKEVYFVNDKEALCYNELLQQFISFYDYGNMNTLVSINGHMYGIKDTNIHKMFEGNDYCSLFGEPRDYSITYKINKDPFIDKTWTNIEYRTDIFDSGNIADKNSTRNIPLETFDTLEVWNEYQKGITDLSKAKCKFRIWRADIPRDINEGKGLNRIRNPWIMLKLNKSGNKRMEFHDLLIKYLQ